MPIHVGGTLPPVLAMRPHFVEKLWGGARLASLPAKAREGHRPPPLTGESWEVADLPEGTSVVEGGPLHGMTLREVVERFERALVGERADTSRFPLLVKLLDAADDLSVQVHPGDDYARDHPGTFSKDEAWLVVDAAPGAQVLHGFKDGVLAPDFAAAVTAGRAHELLRAVPVRAGDVLRIAPGTVHAVGKGCVLLEVQEPSDTTFRVFDYDRVDKDGRRRALHVEQALAVARFGPQDPALASPAATGRLVQTAHFAMARGEVAAGAPPVPLEKPRGEPAVVYALAGDVVVGDVALPRGGSAVVAAAAQGVVVGGAGRFVVMTTGADSR